MKLRFPAFVLMLLVTLFLSSCEVVSLTAPPPLPSIEELSTPPAGQTVAAQATGPGVAYRELFAKLSAAGAAVEEAGEVTQPFFSVQGYLLRLENENVQIFEYADAATAGTEAATISPSGEVEAVEWRATPHFYRQDMLIALYEGDNPAITAALEAALGPQFAGGPAPVAAAPVGASISGQVWHDLCPVQGGTGCVRSPAGGSRANGTLEPGEPGLGGVQVSLGAGPCPAAEQSTTTTDADGGFTFTGLNAGTYCVSVDALSRWNTSLIPGEWTAPEGAQSGLARVTVELAENENKSGIIFGWDFQFLPDPNAPQPTATPGPTPTPAPTARNCTDSAVMTADVTIPDNTRLPAGQTFLKTWRLRNTGTCTWDTSYSLVFASGEQMSGRGAVPFPGPVAPGDSVDLSVNLTVPAEPGTYRGDWSLRNGAGNVFGISNSQSRTFWVQVIAVAAPTQTPAPTPTATATVPLPTAVPTAVAPTEAPAVTAEPAPATEQPAAPETAPVVTPVARQNLFLPPEGGITSFTLTLGGSPSKGYVVSVQANQQLSISVSNPFINVTLLDPRDAVQAPYWVSAEGRYDFLLAEAGDYTFFLDGTGETVVNVELSPAGMPSLERVMFAEGVSSIALTGSLAPGQNKAYVLTTASSVEMRVVVSVPGIEVSVSDAGGQRLAPLWEDENGRSAYGLPDAGDYVVVLEGEGTNTVTIDLAPL